MTTQKVKVGDTWYPVNEVLAVAGEGGVSDHGLLTGLADDDHPHYLTQTRGAALYDPLGSAVGQIQAHEGKANPHPQYAASGHVHPATTSVREFLIYEATSAPTAGNLHIATSGSTRTFRVSKTDADGNGYSLAPLLPGDGITLTDDPDTPPITGFARYVVTTDVFDQGTYWQFDSLRTDTSGSTTVTPGSRVRFIPTLSASPVDTAMPAYITAGADNVQGIGTLWQRVITMPYDLPAGTYEVGFAIEWISDVADQTFYVRVSRNNGGSWRAYSKKNTDVTQYQTFFYQYPVAQAATASTALLECKSASGTTDIEFSDMWIRRVA
jgi:hypothetical protein